ncbi:MAG: hypothetical protein KBG28_23615 [Kofleriaceae bacterium]|nr:hypothetical protein [Kofleriaceae bacterium]
MAVTPLREFEHAYRASIVPLLERAGFAGRWDRLEQQVGRGEFLAAVRREARDTRVVVSLNGTVDGAGYGFLHQRYPLTTAAKARADVRSLRGLVGVALAKLDQARATIPPPAQAPTSIAQAIAAVLGRVAADKGPFGDGRDRVALSDVAVTVRGRVATVTARADRRVVQARADRTALITLLRGLIGAEVMRRDRRSWRSVMSCQELYRYVTLLAATAPDDAACVLAHVDLFDLPELDACRQVVARVERAAAPYHAATSENAMIKRALPRARRGPPLQRVAALAAIDLAISGAEPARFPELPGLPKALAAVATPLLRECGWLLVDSLPAPPALQAAAPPAEGCRASRRTSSSPPGASPPAATCTGS